MPFIPAQNVAQVQMVYTWDNQIVENVYNFDFTVQPDEAVMTDLAEAMVSWWDTNFKAVAGYNFALLKVIVKDMTTRNSPAIEYQVGLPLYGSNNGTFSPNNVTVAVKWLTGLRGRSFRGRTYHMPMPTGWISANALGSGVGATLLSKYGDLLTVMAGQIVATLSVVSRISNGSPRTQALVNHVIGLSIDSTVDSQRRRLPQRGQ